VCLSVCVYTSLLQSIADSFIYSTCLAGNKRLRELIARQAPLYKTSTTKEQKGVIITEIVQTVITTSPTNSGFVKQDKESGRWFFIGMEKAKDKIGHALRKASQRQSKTNKPVAEKTKRTKQEPPETIFDQEPQHDLLPIASHDTSSPCTPSLSAESWPVDINNPTNDELQTRKDDSFYHPQQHQHHPYYYPPNAYSYYPQYLHYPPSTYHYQPTSPYPPPTTTITPVVTHKNEQPLNVYTSYEEV
jgi:hypothetical protein